MKMTIDEAIHHLDTWSTTHGSGQTTDKQHEEAKKISIETMCKYQKMQGVLDKIRAEIDGIEINGQVDEHTSFIRTGEQVKQMAFDIIDKYKAESEEA